MDMMKRGTTGSPVVAACVVVLGLLVLWVAQPVLPSWACAVSTSEVCPPQLLPVRALVIGTGVHFALLVTVAVGLLFRPQANRWLGSFSRGTVFAVPITLALTVIAHFLIPQS